MSPNPAERVISPHQAHEWMAKYPVIIVDVRTEAEFATGYIKNAMLIPLDSLSELAQKKLPDKDSFILIYCRSGRRSNTALLELLNMGYTNVYDFGGILDWHYGIVYP